jgi:hypothetical protein
MLFQPAIIALLVGSVLTGVMLLYSCYYGVVILRRWEIKSGSELQLNLERRTYLISTLLTYAFGFQLLSLFLFIYTADRLNTLFVGAMCAAGTLYVNAWGYPAVILKIVNFLLAGLWLIVNYADNKAYDYPLIKKKYFFLLLITPIVLAEAVVQAGYFLGLKPDIITSCCGTLFTSESSGIAAEIITLPRGVVEAAFYCAMAFAFVTGIFFCLKGRGASLFSLGSAAAFLLSAVAFLSFICLYIYELPTHHCPFCILQREYNFVGYPIYAAFLGGGISGMGVGVLRVFGGAKSLEEILPGVQRRLCVISLVFYALFMVIVSYQMIFSNLVM